MEKVFVETNSFSFALFKNSIRLIWTVIVLTHYRTVSDQLHPPF